MFILMGKFCLHAPVKVLITLVCMSDPLNEGVNNVKYGRRFALCGLRGCKNWPAPFLGRISYKATKPGL